MDLDGGLTGLRHTIDAMSRRLVAITVGAAVVLGACGSSSPEQSVPDDAVDDPLPDADELIDEAESLGITPLALAFDQAAEAAAYRAEIAMGMTMSLGPAGTIDFPADPATPMSFVEVDSDGEQYTRVDLAPMMNAMLGSSGLGDGIDATGIFGGDLSMETWLSGSTITIDLGGFAPMLEQNAGAAAGIPRRGVHGRRGAARRRTRCPRGRLGDHGSSRARSGRDGSGAG